MLEIIILAAGRGTRMRSLTPKVLHALAGEPLLGHVLKAARNLRPDNIHIVVGYGADEVERAVAAEDVMFHIQTEQLGTGHAVAQALPHCHPDSKVLVLFGDVPLIQSESLAQLIQDSANGLGLLAVSLDDPKGYGRIVRDVAGHFAEIVEDRDCTDAQKQLTEVNTGILVGPAEKLSILLAQVGNDNAQGEFYLPDVLRIAVDQGDAVTLVGLEDAEQMMGVNDLSQLETLERVFQQRAAETLLQQGVAIVDRSRIDIRGTLKCGAGVRIDVNAVFEGDVTLADGVSVGANCVIIDSVIGANTSVQPFCHIEQARIGGDCRIGPYARLRPGSALADEVRVGNFVETKNSQFGQGSKANHLAYVGDSEIGAGSNIGAGTITCNYDGVNKHKTILGDGVFVGSNSTLVAPVTLGDQAFIAAGSVVTEAVADNELALGRARQRNVTGWQRPGSDED